MHIRLQESGTCPVLETTTTGTTCTIDNKLARERERKSQSPLARDTKFGVRGTVGSHLLAQTKAADWRYPRNMESRTVMNWVNHISDGNKFAHRFRWYAESPSYPEGVKVIISKTATKSKTGRRQYHNTSKMRVENPSIFIVAPMNLEEMCTEVLDDRLIVVGSIAEWSDTDDHNVNNSRRRKTIHSLLLDF